MKPQSCPIPPTDDCLVICDGCANDSTFSSAQGGLIVLSSAYCPDCATRICDNLRLYNEEQHIHAICPANVSFAEFVVRYRAGKLPAQENTQNRYP